MFSHGHVRAPHVLDFFLANEKKFAFQLHLMTLTGHLWRSLAALCPEAA
jgi:hypothetical protein